MSSTWKLALAVIAIVSSIGGAEAAGGAKYVTNKTPYTITVTIGARTSDCNNSLATPSMDIAPGATVWFPYGGSTYPFMNWITVQAAATSNGATILDTWACSGGGALDGLFNTNSYLTIFANTSYYGIGIGAHN